MAKKWEIHVALCQIIRQHPDWDDRTVAEAAGLHQLELDLIPAARRDVEADQSVPR